MTDYCRGFYGTQTENVIDTKYRLIEVRLGDWSPNESWECQEWYVEDSKGNTLGELDKYGDCIPFAKCSDVAGWEIDATRDRLYDMIPDLTDASVNKILDSIKYDCDTNMPLAARFSNRSPAKPNSDSECIIVCTKDYFSSDCQATAKNRPHPLIDDDGNELIFETYATAKAYVDKLNAEEYVCDSGEAGRPDYVIYKL